jgi:uncharacterized OB-fold protein
MTFPSVTRNAESETFFDAAARGVLMLRQCTACSRVRAARRRTCRHCGDTAAWWVKSAGEATLITWARHPVRASTAGTGLFGLVELGEGPWMETVLVDVRDEQLQVGLPLRVRFVSGDSGDAHPVFGAAESEVRR